MWNPKDDDNKIKPYHGQRFIDIESCFTFYIEYGRKGGFDVRKSTQIVRNNIIVTKYIVCSMNHETLMSKNSDANSESSYASTTIGVKVKKKKREGQSQKNMTATQRLSSSTQV